STGNDTAWLLILDSMIFRAEAEARWLDHCEASLLRHQEPVPTHDVPLDTENTENTDDITRTEVDRA
ncbi:MAG: hypothetical protein ACRD0P_40275, partial [Stackebrandtia sp.]